MECAICAIAKYENLYIPEWMRYHINLGFSHIYIYDNNDINGERIEDVIPNELTANVTIIDVRGQKFMQKKVYNDCYYKYPFDWCAFIDIDEFVTFHEYSHYHSIQEFLNDKSSFDCVHLNWKCFGDSGLIHYSRKSVQSRFIEAWPTKTHYTYIDIEENKHIKSIIRKGLEIDWMKGTHLHESNPHTPSGLARVCNSNGCLIDNAPFADISNEAYIRHYTTKSIEEYSAKVYRQCADCDAIAYTYPKFFRVNAPTFRKLYWLKKNVPAVNIKACLNEYLKYTVVNKKLPLRFLYKSLSRK